MVWHTGALGGTRFGRGDIEAAIDLQRVAADEFAAERLGKFDREGRLTAGGRTDDGEERGPA